MASRQPPRPGSQFLPVLQYSDRFDYPLTFEELKYWTISPSLVPPLTLRGGRQGELFEKTNGFYHLPGRTHLVKLRQRREKFSRQKWFIARAVGESLRGFPTILAVYVTGALAMSNCQENDDLDLMVVTSPNTLWVTRFLLFLYLTLKSLRRPSHLPEHSSPRVRDKICDNLYLDSSFLTIQLQNIYTAHEILQAKCLWDRGGIHPQFLQANSWVKNYLPVAYTESNKNFKLQNLKLNKNLKLKIENLLLWPINLFFFALQYLYMKPKMISERVGLHFAFFHPNSPPGP